MWEGPSCLMGNKIHSGTVDFDNINDETISNKVEIAEKFDNYFSTMATELNYQIPIVVPPHVYYEMKVKLIFYPTLTSY